MRFNTPRLAAGKNARSAFRSSGACGIMPNIYFSAVGLSNSEKR